MVVGLTGPIGSGKSTVAKIFCDNGYKLIDADVLARKVVEKGSKTLSELAKCFGEDIINPDGTLNRSLLATRAFENKDMTDNLNNITHPAILELVKENIKEYEHNGYTKIIYEAPVLFESNSDKFCDKVVSVISYKSQRIARVKKRDNMSDNDIENRLNAQFDDSYYIEKSDFVIYNNSSYEDLNKAVLEVVSKLNEVHNVTLH